MKTWILMTASSTAAIYLYDSKTQTFYFRRNISNRRLSAQSSSIAKFAQYLSDEMELACGAGTNARLIICSEPNILPKILNNLSTQVKSALLKSLKITGLERKLKNANLEMITIMKNLSFNKYSVPNRWKEGGELYVGI